MKPFRFLDWQMYIDGQKIFREILKITTRLPREYRFEFGSQLNRAAFSIILNIAEGCGRKSDKELSRFVDISSGSLYETYAALDTLRDVGLLEEKEFGPIASMLKDLGKQMGGFKRTLD